MAELIHKSLASFCLLHNSFLVVLPQRSRKLVIIHGRSILSLAPQSGHFDAIDNLEDPFIPVDPVDVVPIELRLQQ